MFDGVSNLELVCCHTHTRARCLPKIVLATCSLTCVRVLNKLERNIRINQLCERRSATQIDRPKEEKEKMDQETEDN